MRTHEITMVVAIKGERLPLPPEVPASGSCAGTSISSSPAGRRGNSSGGALTGTSSHSSSSSSASRFPAAVRRLLQDCWVADPWARPEASEVARRLRAYMKRLELGVPLH